MADSKTMILYPTSGKIIQVIMDAFAVPPCCAAEYIQKKTIKAFLLLDGALFQRIFHSLGNATYCEPKSRCILLAFSHDFSMARKFDKGNP
jgi:hypothetical protein